MFYFFKVFRYSLQKAKSSVNKVLIGALFKGKEMSNLEALDLVASPAELIF